MMVTRSRMEFHGSAGGSLIGYITFGNFHHDSGPRRAQPSPSLQHQIGPRSRRARVGPPNQPHPILNCMHDILLLPTPPRLGDSLRADPA